MHLPLHFSTTPCKDLQKKYHGTTLARGVAGQGHADVWGIPGSCHANYIRVIGHRSGGSCVCACYMHSNPPPHLPSHVGGARLSVLSEAACMAEREGAGCLHCTGGEHCTAHTGERGATTRHVAPRSMAHVACSPWLSESWTVPGWHNSKPNRALHWRTPNRVKLCTTIGNRDEHPHAKTDFSDTITVHGMRQERYHVERKNHVNEVRFGERSQNMACTVPFTASASVFKMAL